MNARAGLQVCGVLAAFGVGARFAHADELPAAVSLDARSCAAIPARELERLLRLELQGDVLADARADRPRVRIACEADRVNLSAQGWGATNPRDLDLSGVAHVARPRLLALSIVELLSGRPPTAVPPVLTAPPRPHDALDLLAFALTRVDRSRHFHLGVGARGAVAVSSRIGLHAEATFTRGRASQTEGRVDTHVIAGTLGVHGDIPIRGLSLRGALGARAAWARLTGTATDPLAFRGERVNGVAAGACGFVALRAAWARVRVELALEAGHWLRPVRGVSTSAETQDVTRAAVAGPYAGVRFGVGFAP